jgi:hypothetical protein
MQRTQGVQMYSIAGHGYSDRGILGHRKGHRVYSVHRQETGEVGKLHSATLSHSGNNKNNNRNKAD